MATTLEPKAQVHQFAFLQVKAIENVGAFLDWGLDKDLMVPFREQRQRMEKGRWYVVYVTIDERTGRIMATNKIEQRLDNHQLTVQQGEEVELLILQKTDLGYSSIINHRHKGLLYDNELFSGVNIGETMKGYIKNIRSDNKIDLSLQPQGYLNATDDHTSLIMEQLQAKNGFIPLNDKSPADQVYSTLGISKKAFKRAVGSLYKARKIMIEEGGIRLI